MMENSLLCIELPLSKSLDTFPVEILHRILDYLEVKDILFSFRYVCTKFNAITNIYNRLTIEPSNYRSKVAVGRLCQIIQPEKVVSLILRKWNLTSTFDEIDWFYSSIDIHAFTRLRFLNIANIKERHLQTILHHVTTISTLTSLKIYDRSLMNDNIIDDLSKIIALPSLRILDLDISCIIIDKLTWPNHCQLQKMTTLKCSHKKWCQILQYSPYLRRFSTGNFDMNNIDNTIRSISYKQMTSLILNDIRLTIDQLEFLLLPLSSLIYLNLKPNENVSFEFLKRFSQWEYFIKDKLPLLKQFHFYMSTLVSRYQNLHYIELIISGFRTPFWIEYKHWYVFCQYFKNKSQFIIKSSINENTDFFRYQNYQDDDDEISYFTHTKMDDKKSNMTNVWNGRFGYLWLMSHNNKPFKQTNNIMFNKWNRLILDMDGFTCWKFQSFDYLSTLINLSQLNEIWLFIPYREGFNPEFINNLLEKASNVKTLGISHYGDFTSIIDDVSSILSNHVDHLKIRLEYINYMKLIVERVQQFSSITFIHDWSLLSHQMEMIEWLNQKQIKFSIKNDYQYLQIWFNKNIIESSEIEMKKTSNNFNLIDH